MTGFYSAGASSLEIIMSFYTNDEVIPTVLTLDNNFLSRL